MQIASIIGQIKFETRPSKGPNWFQPYSQMTLTIKVKLLNFTKIAISLLLYHLHIVWIRIGLFRCCPTSAYLSRSYLEKYKRYNLETSYVDRSREVQSTTTITLAFMIFELLPFILGLHFVLTQVRGGKRYALESSQVDRSH